MQALLVLAAWLLLAALPAWLLARRGGEATAWAVLTFFLGPVGVAGYAASRLATRLGAALATRRPLP